MSETSNAPVGESAPAPVADAPAVTNNEPTTASEAARALSQRRWEKARAASAPEPAAEAAPVEAPQTEFAQEADAAPETDPGETQDAEPAEVPTIEPPRSWTKDEKERFATLPRETQEYIASREQERERAIRQSQNEAAEIRKAAEAERAKAEQARQQYEQTLPALLETLQAQQAGQFADIKTQADVQRLATEDPLRYIQWNAHREQVAAIQNEARQAQERQAQEWNQKWQEFAAKEDARTVEAIPELADPKQRGKVQEAALNYLKDKGFTDSELGSAWNGQASLSLRDHRIQGLIRDAVKFREMEAASKAKLAAKPLPTVQRPGVAAPKVDTGTAALAKRLEQTGSIQDAAALVMARRAAARR